MIKNGRNVAASQPVKASGERAPYRAKDLVDGRKSSEQREVGYWWAEDHRPAWIEIDLSKGAPHPVSKSPAATGELLVGVPISQLSISNDGGTLLLNCAGVGRLFTLADRHEVGEPRPLVVQAGFLPDGQTPFTAPWEGAWSLWNPETGERAGAGFNGFQVKSLAFSADGRLAAVGELRGMLAITDLASHEERRLKVFDRNHAIEGLAISPDGHRVLAVCPDGSAKWISTVSGADAGPIEGPLSTKLALLADGRIVSTTYADGNDLEVRDATSGKIVARWQGHTAPIAAVAVSSRGDCLSVAADKTVRLWDPATGTSRTLVENDAPLIGASFSVDGHQLVVSDSNSKVRWWLDWPRLESNAGHEAGTAAELAEELPAETLFLKDMPLLSSVRDEALDGSKSLDGAPSPHGLLLRPAGSVGNMVFDVAKRQAVSLRGRVGLNDRMSAPQAKSPQTFRIVIDGKTAWKSKPLLKRGAGQEFALPLDGVKKIELITESPDADPTAQPLWFEPRLHTMIPDAVAQLSAIKGPVDAKALDRVRQGINSSAQHRELALALRAAAATELIADHHDVARRFNACAALAVGAAGELGLATEIGEQAQQIDQVATDFEG